MIGQNALEKSSGSDFSDSFGCSDSEPHLFAADIDDGDLDVIADLDYFVALS